MSEQQKPQSALERLETLEKSLYEIAQTVNALNQGLGTFQQRLRQVEVQFSNLDKGANALTQVLVEAGTVDKDVLFKTIETNVVAERKAIEDSWVSTGAAVETLSVEEEGIVAISERQPDGKFAALREHIEVSKLNPDVKPLIVGKSVGEEIGLPNGNIVTVIRAFKPAEYGHIEGGSAQTEAQVTEAEVVSTETVQG